MGEDFRLKWNDHHSTFFSTAEQLCHGDHLTDVTLSCGSREFSAHKLVLSICSAYFSQLFAPRVQSDRKRRPADSAAIVYLRDIDPRHMELLLNYMYRGEINVEEEELMAFLATAKSLQVKGLTESSESDLDEPVQGHKPNRHEPVLANSATNRPSKKRPAMPKANNAAHVAPKKIKEEVVAVSSSQASNEMLKPEDSANAYHDDHDQSNTGSGFLEPTGDPIELTDQDNFGMDEDQPEAMMYEGDPDNPGVSVMPTLRNWLERASPSPSTPRLEFSLLPSSLRPPRGPKPKGGRNNR